MKNKYISCNHSINNKCFQSCVLGKHISLPFYEATSFTLSPFDIVHSDLWTTPVVNSAGHSYYVVLLDDYSNLLWTTPIAKKSQVFALFQKFYTYVSTQFNCKLKNYIVIMDGSMKTLHFIIFVRKMRWNFAFVVHTSQHKIEKLSVKSEQSITSFVLFYSMHQCHPSFGIMHWQWLHISIIFLQLNYSKISPPTQLLYDQHPSYEHLRVFGCLCYPLFASTTIHKLQARFTSCVLGLSIKSSRV